MMASDLQRLRAASGTVAIVGVGETDYAADYPVSRAGQAATDHYGFGIRAFKAALNDAGLRRDEIDGVIPFRWRKLNAPALKCRKSHDRLENLSH